MGNKARELVALLDRENRMAELVKLGSMLRLGIAWPCLVLEITETSRQQVDRRALYQSLAYSFNDSELRCTFALTFMFQISDKSPDRNHRRQSARIGVSYVETP